LVWPDFGGPSKFRGGGGFKPPKSPPPPQYATVSQVPTYRA